MKAAPAVGPLRVGRGWPAWWWIPAAAAAVRLALVGAGRVVDTLWEVRYTDVDYDVVTDGAALVLAGRSPYERATYRYAPALAWLLTPNVWLLPEWGKLLFSACDLAVGAAVWSILVAHGGLPPQRAAACAAAFLLNPFVVNVSTRGNADALVALCVVGALWGVLGGRPALGGAALGAAVHLKLYPVVYALPLGLWLLQPDRRGMLRALRAPGGGGGDAVPPPLPPPSLRPAQVRAWLRGARWRDAALFAAACAGALGGLTAASAAAYGPEFLHAAVAYHAGRTDPRHNFSPAWLPQLYALHARAEGGAGGPSGAPLGVGGAGGTVLQRWGAAAAAALASPAGGAGSGGGTAAATALLAAPQLALVAWLGWRYHAAHLPLALFAQTAAFVHWNRVVTAQYFTWWAALLPLVLPHSRLGRPGWAAVAGAWAAAELAWSWPALHLELRGQAAHVRVWAGSALFFAASAGALAVVLAAHGHPAAAKGEDGRSAGASEGGAGSAGGASGASRRRRRGDDGGAHRDGLG